MAHKADDIRNIIKGENKINGKLDSTSTVLAPDSSATSMPQPTTTIKELDWQTTKATLRERVAVMFDNQLISDITFIVGPSGVKLIPAHKFVLATGSPVFYAMFYGGLAECKEKIEVPDVDPSAFLILLKYLYCDEIKLEAETVLPTLYVAKKYIVPHLIKHCVNFLEATVTEKNVCMLLSQPCLSEERELMQRCWEITDTLAIQVLTSEEFLDIDLSTLKSVLARETLNIKEINVFEAALAWAQAACIKNELEPTPANKRAMLGDAINLIRFPTLTLDELANIVVPSGILTLQESHDMFLLLTAANKPSLLYPTKPRTGQKLQICNRFHAVNFGGTYRGKSDAICFDVNKRIFLFGFGLYSSSNGSAEYKVRIELHRDGNILAEHDTKFFSDDSGRAFHVCFKNPIRIEADCVYTALVTIHGTNSYIGEKGSHRVRIGGVDFRFHCSPKSKNITDVEKGQIPEFIFMM